jgi:toxin FitB
MSIILDTNVISELQGRLHSARILAWLNGFQREQVFLTTISVAEIHFGLSMLPQGRRRQALEATYSRIEDGFSERILPFSIEAARAYGSLTAERRKIGRPIETKDAMIAAICLSRDAALATRNLKDFEGLDLRLLNPFEDA